LNTCIIGVGNAGIKITKEVLERVNLDYLLLENRSSTGSDFDNKIEITIPTRINPSLDHIRKALLDSSKDILSKVNQYQSIIIVGNLASKFGSAVLPVLSQMLRDKINREIICLTILPFGFEKEKLFRCGVSLSFLCKLVSSVIVIDNNAIIRNDTDISIDQCYKITNTAIVDIIVQSLIKSFPEKLNFVNSNISTNGIKNAFIETMAQLTQKIDINSIQKCSLYLYQPSEKISIENGRWGPFIRFGKKMLKLGRKEDGEKYSAEELINLPIEEVKKMIEQQVPGAFSKKAATKKTATKKVAAKKTAKKTAAKKK